MLCISNLQNYLVSTLLYLFDLFILDKVTIFLSCLDPTPLGLDHTWFQFLI